MAHLLASFRWSPDVITQFSVRGRKSLVVEARDNQLSTAYLAALRNLPDDDLLQEEQDFISETDAHANPLLQQPAAGVNIFAANRALQDNANSNTTHTNPLLHHAGADLNLFAANRFAQDNIHTNANNIARHSPAPSYAFSTCTPTYTDMSLEDGPGQLPSSLRKIVNDFDDHVRDPLARLPRKTRRGTRSQQKQPRKPDPVQDVACPQSQTQPQVHHSPGGLPDRTDHQPPVRPPSRAPQSPHTPHQSERRHAASDIPPQNTHIASHDPPSPSMEELNRQYDEALAKWTAYGEKRLELDCLMKALQRQMHLCADHHRSSLSPA